MITNGGVNHCCEFMILFSCAFCENFVESRSLRQMFGGMTTMELIVVDLRELTVGSFDGAFVISNVCKYLVRCAVASKFVSCWIFLYLPYQSLQTVSVSTVLYTQDYRFGMVDCR